MSSNEYRTLSNSFENWFCKKCNETTHVEHTHVEHTHVEHTQVEHTQVEHKTVEADNEIDDGNELV